MLNRIDKNSYGSLLCRVEDDTSACSNRRNCIFGSGPLKIVQNSLDLLLGCTIVKFPIVQPISHSCQSIKNHFQFLFVPYFYKEELGNSFSEFSPRSSLLPRIRRKSPFLRECTHFGGGTASQCRIPPCRRAVYGRTGMVPCRRAVFA